MSWGLAAGWLAVAGTTLLTVGTGTQARAALAQYKFLRQSIPDAALDSVTSSLLAQALVTFVSPGGGSRFSRWVPDWVSVLAMYVRVAVLSVVLLPGYLVEIRAGDKDDVIELGQFLRLTVVWGILMCGSALALAAAAVQLALAYQ